MTYIYCANLQQFIDISPKGPIIPSSGSAPERRAHFFKKRPKIRIFPRIRLQFNTQNNMFDLKVIHSVLDQLEEERGIPREKIIEAIEMALATAYKKEYGRKDQFIRAHFDISTGNAEFYQVKVAVDPAQVVYDKDNLPEIQVEGEEKVLFNEERHILIDDAQKIKKNVKVGDEIVFDLENKADYGRIAAQTAKQVIIQKIREAEKTSVLAEYGKKEGEVISGSVQRVERGNVFIDMGRAVGMLPYEEQSLALLLEHTH